MAAEPRWRKAAEEKRDALETIAAADLPLSADAQALLHELDAAEEESG